MNIPIYQVDAFTIKPFTGNPAAVCLLEQAKDDAWMQAVAAEMALSETAFLVPKSNRYHLRWFTPTTEVKLCGHATLASAHILFENGFYEEDELIEFYTLSGTLKASNIDGFVELDLPRFNAKLIDPPQELSEALGIKPIRAASYENEMILAEFDGEDSIRGLAPNFELLKALSFHDVIVTAKAEKGKYDFISRFFAPKVGINEDPVTGSAHCLLGPYWAPKLDKQEFLAFQASARSGEVRVRLQGERVFVGGKAITVLQGKLIHQ